MVALAPLTSPPSLSERYRAMRARTRSLFEIPIDDAYLDRPIPLRNPLVFYDGHLPVFAVNTLLKLARGERGIDERFESLFARGIDPEDESSVSDAAAWPRRDEVAAYAREAESRIERALSDLEGELQREAAGTILEHELMHQETFAYLLHALPYERKNPRRNARDAQRPFHAPGGFARIPAGVATLGGDATSFGWDNEFPQHTVHVDAFEIARLNITNGEYLEFVRATGANAPHFWLRKDGQWFWRGMFAPIPLPFDWPAYVTHEQATAFAQWRGCRLMTEAEFHRAAEGIAWDAVDGNLDFARWDPEPVGCGSASRHAVRDLVGNGWEWTSTVFDAFDGFQPMPTYPQYSADFFDGAHFVMKGASPATPSELLRESFRNWFRPNYPWVYAKFRLAR